MTEWIMESAGGWTGGWIDRRPLPRPGRADLWLLPTRGLARCSRLLALLSPAERSRASGLPTGAVRDTLVASRALQRWVAAAYLGLSPQGVEFDRSCPHCPAGADHGRPRIRPATGLDYSVSHTADWLLVAVVGGGRVGVDIEAAAALRDPDRLAGVVLGAAERAETAGPASLLQAWCRKEAAMKVTGFGLRANARELDVRGRMLAVGDVPGWPAEGIHLRDADAPAGHAAAIASTEPLDELVLRAPSEMVAQLRVA